MAKILAKLISDVDECGNKESPCGENAQCINQKGSHQCVCNQGYTGDGLKCSCKFFVFLNQKGSQCVCNQENICDGLSVYVRYTVSYFYYEIYIYFSINFWLHQS